MTVTSKDCKEAIVRYAVEHEQELQAEFCEPVDIAPAFKVSNWKRIIKEKENGGVTRVFDCKPFDDQLRAYVVEKDGAIHSVHVQGE